MARIFSKYYIYISFYPENSRTSTRKTSITDKWLVVESCPFPRWITFLIFCGLVYDIPSLLVVLILVWCTLLQLREKVSHQNSRLVYEIIPFLKQTVSEIYYSDILILIVLLLWNWKERQSTVGQVLFEPVNVWKATEIYLRLGIE